MKTKQQISQIDMDLFVAEIVKNEFIYLENPVWAVKFNGKIVSQRITRGKTRVTFDTKSQAITFICQRFRDDIIQLCKPGTQWFHSREKKETYYLCKDVVLPELEKRGIVEFIEIKEL